MYTTIYQKEAGSVKKKKNIIIKIYVLKESLQVTNDNQWRRTKTLRSADFYFYTILSQVSFKEKKTQENDKTMLRLIYLLVIGFGISKNVCIFLYFLLFIRMCIKFFVNCFVSTVCMYSLYNGPFNIIIIIYFKVLSSTAVYVYIETTVAKKQPLKILLFSN